MVVYNLQKLVERNASAADCPGSGKPSVNDETKVKVLQVLIHNPKKS